MPLLNAKAFQSQNSEVFFNLLSVGPDQHRPSRGKLALLGSRTSTRNMCRSALHATGKQHVSVPKDKKPTQKEQKCHVDRHQSADGGGRRRKDVVGAQKTATTKTASVRRAVGSTFPRLATHTAGILRKGEQLPSPRFVSHCFL